MDLSMAKKVSVGIVNPVAKAMLQVRKAPQVVPSKKGSKAKRNRKQEKYDAIRDEKFHQND